MQGVSLLHLALRLPYAVVRIVLRRLSDFDQANVSGRRIVRRPRVDAQARLRLGREDVVDGFTHWPRPSDASSIR